MVRPEKGLVSGNRPGEKFFYHSPARLIEYLSEYTFLISKTSKQTNKQINKKETRIKNKQKKLKKKRKYLGKID